MKNNYCHQHTFCEIANYVVNSRLSLARSLVVTENTRLRSSQPRKAWERWRKPSDNNAHKKTFLRYYLANN